MTAAIVVLGVAGKPHGGLDVLAVIGLVAALISAAAAALGILLYLIGAIRPLKVKEARWRQAASGEIEFTCYIRNRSPMFDRKVTGLVLVEAPERLFDRLTQRWRKKEQAVEVILQSTAHDRVRNGQMVITKRDEEAVVGELVDPSNNPKAPTERTRLEAWAGSARSRSSSLSRA